MSLTLMEKMHLLRKNHQLQSWNNKTFLFSEVMYTLTCMVTLLFISQSSSPIFPTYTTSSCLWSHYLYNELQEHLLYLVYLQVQEVSEGWVFFIYLFSTLQSSVYFSFVSLPIAFNQDQLKHRHVVSNSHSNWPLCSTKFPFL